jgi:lipopolysaccharide export LptBFGC system permease protein LptF
MKPSAIVTLIFLCLVAVIHLVRFVFQVNITVDAVVVPMWASLVAFFALGALALWLWREQRA